MFTVKQTQCNVFFQNHTNSLPRRDLGGGQNKRDFSLTRMGSVGNPVANWTDSLPRRDFYNMPANNTNSLPRRDRAGKIVIC